MLENGNFKMQRLKSRLIVYVPGQLCISVVKFILGLFTSSERFDIRLLCQLHTNFLFSAYLMFL